MARAAYSAARGTPPSRSGWKKAPIPALLIAAASALIFAACGGPVGGDGNAGVDWQQFQIDAGGYSLPGGLTSLDFGASDYYSSADCVPPETGVKQLEADTAGWPSVLQAPMGNAEKEFEAAISACTAGDYATMTSHINKGKDFLAATRQAFTAHCADTAHNFSVGKWYCSGG